MITQDQFQELLSFQPTETKVLSLYLSTDTSLEPPDMIRLKAKNLLRDVSGYEKDVQAIETYLNHSFDWSAQGLVVFSSQDGDFFRAYPTAVSFRNRLRVTPKPYLKPLGHLLDHYAHYGVILVDRVGARFFRLPPGGARRSGRLHGRRSAQAKAGTRLFGRGPARRHRRRQS
jgi:peptide chain release factor subunit 1